MRGKWLIALGILISIIYAVIPGSNTGSAVALRPSNAEDSGAHPAGPGESYNTPEQYHREPIGGKSGLTITVAPDHGRYRSIQAAVTAAGPGDTILIKAGTYNERVILNKALTLRAESGAILDGGGEDDVLTLLADGCVISGLEVRNSGKDLSKDHAGIKIKSNYNVIAQNKLRENAMGIYLYAANDNTISGNVLVGRREISESQRGNGIHLWKSDRNTIQGNVLTSNRDALYFSFANDNIIAENTAHGQRVGVHYMYSNNNKLTGNNLHDNINGLAMMNSHANTIQGNRIFQNQENGIILKELDDNLIEDNLIYNNKLGIYIYNADRNKLTGNLLAANMTGLNITAGSDYNLFSGNSWEQNQVQVDLSDPVHNRWDDGKRGNYWSEYASHDLNGDGLGDKIYWQNTLVQYLVAKSPLVKLLFNSPVLQAVEAAEKAFPVLRPPGVIDNFPLMQPPLNSSSLEINWYPRFFITPSEQGGHTGVEHMEMAM